MDGLQFPPGFVWGTATAAYQIEGSPLADGACESIWHRFSHTPGKIKDGSTGDVACDHYRRFREDVSIMRELGLTAYRFSIAWGRVFPDHVGRPSGKGLGFYERLVDLLLEAGIEPFVTLYHWDLPMWVFERGGWLSRDTSERFSDYAAALFERLGDRVRRWITLNEPWVVSHHGYLTGEHAPGHQNEPAAMLASAHHQLVGHGLAVRAFRQSAREGSIGIALNLCPTFPASDRPEDDAAARRFDGHLNRWYLDPIFRGRFPEDMVAYYDHDLPDPRFDDLALISSPIDFLGVNYYSRWTVADDPNGGYLNIRRAPPEGAELNSLGWETYPEGLYIVLARLRDEYRDPEIYITENGLPVMDSERTSEDLLDDPERIDYLARHLSQAHRAILDGVKLRGYFVWSLLDNFEWAWGYGPRFGIIRVEYDTRERRWRRSASWYRECIQRNGL